MKLLKFLYLTGVLWLSCIPFMPKLFGQQVENDTVQQATPLQEVWIFGQRIPKFSVGSRITTLDTTALQSFNTGNLSDILQLQLPVYLKSYGAGMLSSIAFRGTSASHTAVLWNGFTITQPSNGQTDFSLLPVILADEITVQHGNAGTNYGSGAIGGAILLSSPVQFGKGYAASIQQSTGSFGRYFSSIQSSYSNSRIFLRSRFYYHQSQNDFSFINTTRYGKPTEKQTNNSIQQYGVNQEAGIWVSPKHLLTVRGWYTYSHRQIPPAMGAANRNATQLDENIRLAAEWNSFTYIGNTSVKVAVFNEKLLYSEDQLRSSNSIQTLQTQAEHEYSFKEKASIKAGIELQQFYAQVDGYGTNKTETRVSSFLLSNLHLHKRLNLALNLRQAFITGYNPPLTPSAGIRYRLLTLASHQLDFKSNIARSYRVPTLNERFWQVGGNPAIKPEKSWSYENGFLHKWQRNQTHLETELTYYFMKVDNWIQWQPTAQGFWSPVNVMQVNPKGVEVSSHIKFPINPMRVSLGTSYAYTSSTISRSYDHTVQNIGKQLMYVPLHTGNVYGNIYIQSYTIGASIAYTGLRYINNSNTDWLNSFTLVAVTAARSIHWRQSVIRLQGRIHNLTNASYQNMENRPMPGRNFEISIRYEFHKKS